MLTLNSCFSVFGVLAAVAQLASKNLGGQTIAIMLTLNSGFSVYCVLSAVAQLASENLGGRGGRGQKMPSCFL